MKADRSVQVVRDGREQTVSIFDVVVGDIFVVKAGELLPCDGLLLRGSGLKCDESAMTGESLEVPKSVGGEGHSGPYLTAGAQVTAGAGSMIVLTVGPHTSFGKIITDLEDAEPPPTPLQEKLETLAKMIGLVGVAGGVLIFLVLLIAYLIHAKGNYHGAFGSILSYFIIGITIIVVAVPEGLPLAVMIALAYSMRQMIKDKVLVRELNACETMGSVTTICSDKTGTLTENRMTVIKAWVGGVSYFDALPNAEQVGGAPRVDELARAIALNSDAMVTYEAQEHGGRKIVVAGNKSEGALLHFLGSCLSVDFDAVRSKFGHPLFRENFSSARKRMTSVFRDAASGDLNVYCKGASEMVLALCSNIRVADGTTLPLDAARREEILGVIEALAAQGLRTFAVAVRRLPAAAAPCADDAAVEALQAAWEKVLETDVERELTLLLVAGIADPVRAAVPGAVASCKAAGIKVRMVTGDNLVTAKYIAAECGIMMGGECIEGRAWREMTDAQRADLAPRLDVMARAVPQDKLLLVEALKALGQTVAVTGDGTNDAPALRAAHVGCAMGIAGTEVAKEAGKMIILDDNFASIVTAVVWGRSVLENIRKFLVFQLTINLVAGLLTFAMAIEISTHEPSAAAKESGG
jgi:calcium-translocating P-type ATPase